MESKWSEGKDQGDHEGSERGGGGGDGGGGAAWETIDFDR